MDDKEELCDSFEDGFSKKIIEEGIDVGNFDFVQRTPIKAWEDGEISGSKAAEILEMKMFDFMEKYQYEGNT